jgi:CCR4-NOT transcriptional regulation complex NOT5 subunit
MERFRELEKEFKMKQYSKKALLNANNSENYDSDSDGENYGDEIDSMDDD